LEFTKELVELELDFGREGFEERCVFETSEIVGLVLEDFLTGVSGFCVVGEFFGVEFCEI
jgi:hypothetical protein